MIIKKIENKIDILINCINISIKFMSNWDSIPEFISSEDTTSRLLDINVYFEKLYEAKCITCKTIYNDEHTTSVLEKYKAELDAQRNFFDRIFMKIFNQFQKDLQSGLNTSIIEIELDGPNINYTNIDINYINKALNNFCIGLTIKGYEYDSYEQKQGVYDTVEGHCIRHTKHLKITLQ